MMHFDDSDISFTSASTPNTSGYFEVTVDGELVHSKKAGEGFPDDAKVAAVTSKILAIIGPQ
eukprot:m.14605 g.14605  ORF g.14605 m.14605 type:complete len:62 (-) comp10318_c0_seq1:242-427(-)